MPSGGGKLTRYKQYALGIVTESGWILALTLGGFLLAVLAKVIWP